MDKRLTKIYHLLEDMSLHTLLNKPSKELFSSGDLLFNQLGYSVEFNQYNNYMEGDSIKHIDWRQYAKTEKIYSKKFHSESNSKAIMLLDTSTSMEFKTKTLESKGDLASIILGVFMNILMSSDIHVSLISKNKFSGFKRNLDDFPMLIQNIKKEKNFHVLKKLSLIKEIRECSHSTIFIISDFLYETDALLKEIERMKELGYDFHLIQVLTNTELFFDYKGIVEFEDMESHEKLITEPLAIKKLYIEELNHHISNLSETLLKHNMKFNLLNLDKDIRKNILNLFGI